MGAGLVISALIPNPDRGMPLLVLLVMLQVVMCGGLMPLSGRWFELLSWLVPARWAYAMGASTFDLNRMPGSPPDGLWDHTAGTWIIDTFSLGAIGLVLILVTATLIHRRR